MCIRDSVQPVDTTGNYNSVYGQQNQAYQNQLASNNAAMGGLFGLGGSLLGGALGAAGGPAGMSLGASLGGAAAKGLAGAAGYSGPFPSHY